MTIKLGHHILGLKGTIQGRKGYIVHIEANEVWIKLDTGEVMTGVPKDAFQGRKGRPATVHSVVAQKRVQYVDEVIVAKASSMIDLLGIPAPDSSGTVEPEAIEKLIANLPEPTQDIIHLGQVVEGAGEYTRLAIIEKTEDDREREDCAPRPKKVKPPLKLLGMDGNAFFLLGIAVNAGKKAGWTKAEVDAFRAEATSSDYDHLLATICEHFDVEGLETDDDLDFEDDEDSDDEDDFED